MPFGKVFAKKTGDNEIVHVTFSLIKVYIFEVTRSWV